MVGAVSTLYSDPTYWQAAIFLAIVLAILKPIVGWFERWRTRKAAEEYVSSGLAQTVADLNREWEPRLMAAYKEVEAEQSKKTG